MSMMDGRFPITEDYDLASENFGPDDISISSNSTWFRDRRYNTSAGIMFVVGVKAKTANTNYTISMFGPNKVSQT